MKTVKRQQHTVKIMSRNESTKYTLFLAYRSLSVRNVHSVASLATADRFLGTVVACGLLPVTCCRLQQVQRRHSGARKIRKCSQQQQPNNLHAASRDFNFISLIKRFGVILLVNIICMSIGTQV